MTRERVERRLAAILAADIVGYSRLMGRDEVGTLTLLKDHRRALIDPKIAEHKGRIVKTTGDGLLIEFPSVVEAVSCAVAFQQAMAEHNADIAAEDRIEFRVGIHQGDIIVDGADIFGDGVNIAARLEGLAEPGGICVSRRVQEDTAGRVDLSFEDMGDQTLKNIARPVRVFRVTLAAGPQTTPRPAPALPLPEKPSLVVLPFQNMTGDPDQDYFVDGTVDEITTAISRLPWLFVIARNSAFTYKGRAVDVKQVARELGVRYVLEGSVRRAGNRVRITGQLIDTTSGAHIWADRFNGTLDDIFDLQDQVASSVAGAIEPKLRRAEIERAARKPTESLDAYDLYLRAIAEGHKRTRESLAESVRLARQALERDPAYLPAMARVALGLGMQIIRRWLPSSGPEVEETIRMARQVIAAADDPAALTFAGTAITLLTGDNKAALAGFDRAIALNPNFSQAFGHRALTLAFLNRPDEAVQSAQQAIRLSPLDPGLFTCWMALALAHLAAGRYEEGLPWAERARRENGGLPAYRLSLALYGHLGRTEEAKECLRELREITPEPTVAALLKRVPKGNAPENVARVAEGLRKAGLPEA